MGVLTDGFSTTITFSHASATGLEVEEKTIQPPGESAGGEIDVTTMRNKQTRTRVPKQLVTGTPFTLTVAYASADYSKIQGMMGKNQCFTITYPDATAVFVWGWIDEFTPNEHEEGEQPTAELTIIPSNRNNAGVEMRAVYTASGTTTTTTTTS